MQLSQALAAYANQQVRARARQYLIRGAVLHVAMQDDALIGQVEGTDLYDTVVQPSGSRIGVSCTCPYFADHRTICKHLWASILAAEAAGLAVGTAAAADSLVVEPLPEVEDADVDTDWEEERSTAARTGAPPRRIAGSAGWREFLSGVAAGAPQPAFAPPARRSTQLLYVIDVERSRQAGGLVIELATRTPRVNGEWSKPQPERLTSADVAAMADGADRDVLERLLGARPHYDFALAAGDELSRVKLQGATVRELLPLLCATGRCVARMARRTGHAGPLTGSRGKGAADLFDLQWDAGPAWQLRVHIQRDESKGAYRVSGALVRADRTLPVSDPLLLLEDGVLITRTHAAALDHGGAFSWLATLRRDGPVAIPLEARPSLVDLLVGHPPPSVAAPEDLRVVVEQVRPVPFLRLITTRPGIDRLEAELSFEYDGFHVASDAPQAVVRSFDATRIIRRDARTERAYADALHGLGFRQELSLRRGVPVPQIPSRLVPQVVRRLLADGWHVEAEGRTFVRPSEMSLHVGSGIDWFDLEGHVDYGGQRVGLPALLAAARRGEAFVTLSDGDAGVLPEEWLEKYAALAGMGTPHESGVRFTAAQAGLLDALLATQPEATFDETFERARREILQFEGIVAEEPPASFTGSLRGYQREGLGWLLFLRRFGFGGCLADDMGLGKTVMVLALLARCRAETTDAAPAAPALVVAPRSLIFNWRQEAARFTPQLRVVEYVGTDRGALRERLGEYDLVLTTYGTLRRDVVHLTGTPFEYVILDEAQAIKNAASASAKATRLLRARHRLALSGTPIENHVGELWSLFEFLNPGLLGGPTGFARMAASKDTSDAALSLLARALRPFMLRRTKEQVASELPAKTEQTIYCEMKQPQRVLYDELRDHYRRALLDGTSGSRLKGAKLQVLEALLRLRQAACHPALVDEHRRGDASAKLDVLVPRLAEVVEEGHKTLVFSQFTSFLALLRDRLDGEGITYEYLDGQTRDREARVERFQTDDDCRLFLISLKAGGVGLNLTAAEYVFLLDPWWNPAVEAQAIDRAHRIGQTRQVFAYRLIAKDTVEERVLELQQQKRELADAILSADGSMLRDLQREDLELLLS